MALTYLVDMNIVSEIVKPKPNPNVAQAWHSHHANIAIASITWHELLYGLERLPESKRKRGLQTFLFDIIEDVLPILPFDAAAAHWFAKERARLTKIGRPPAFADGQIAAVAVSNNLILVSRNKQDFASFDGLTVENWFD